MEFHHGTATTTATNSPRPGTPDDNDHIEPAQQHNPFQTPYGSMPASAMGSSTGLRVQAPPRYFHSRRINRAEIEKPWLEKKDPKEKWVTIIPIIGMLIGVALTGFLVYEGLQTITNHVYCPVLDEDFSGGFNPKVWTKEVEVGGFGYAHTTTLLLLPKTDMIY